MAKTANINLRIEPETKARAESLFNSFGISVTDAINIFLNTSIMEEKAKTYANLSELLDNLDED